MSPVPNYSSVDGIESSPQVSEKRLRALVVDADRVVAEFVRGQLDELGFRTEVVTTGVQAVIAARREVPNLIVMALQLQDVHGPQLLHWLRSNPELKDVPVIAVHAVGEDAPKLTHGGFAGLLKKPLTADKVRQAVAATFPVPR